MSNPTFDELMIKCQSLTCEIELMADELEEANEKLRQVLNMTQSHARIVGGVIGGNE